MPLLACFVLACLVAWPARTQPACSPGIWDHFRDWVLGGEPERSSSASLEEQYIAQLIRAGVEAGEARRRYECISRELRRTSRDHNALFWDAVFKFGQAPERPLALLVNVAASLRPGRALDVAMGSGRNALYLASLGWQVTGYDISPVALNIARQRARELGISFEALHCGHREFEFGKHAWDLIVLSYIVADDGDLEAVFGERIWDSLRPGGRILCEGNFCEGWARHLKSLPLAGFDLELYFEGDGLRDGWGGRRLPGRVIQAVVLKRE